MKKIILITLLLTLAFSNTIYAQITSNDTIFTNCQTTLNSTQTANSYCWNFYPSSIYNINSLSYSNVGTSSGVTSQAFSSMAFDGTNYYLFSLNHYNGGFVRLKYGSSLSNTPVVTNMGG